MPPVTDLRESSSRAPRRSRLLAAILLPLASSAAACQLLWSYDTFRDQPGTTSSSGTSSSSSSASTSATSSSSASSSGCAIDDDQDGVISWVCNPMAPDDPSFDCADQDPRAFPGDAGFQPTQIVGWGVDGGTRPGLQSFDFNCDGQVTQETKVLSCASCSGVGGYAAPVACGDSASIGDCVNPCGFFACCQFQARAPAVLKTQQCR